jgi:hypothetical protein
VPFFLSQCYSMLDELDELDEIDVLQQAVSTLPQPSP